MFATALWLHVWCIFDAFSSAIAAGLTSPERIETTPGSLLWLLPLSASIAATYKATKLPTIKAANFIRETAVLFGSIVVFVLVSALVLLVVAWLITE